MQDHVALVEANDGVGVGGGVVEQGHGVGHGLVRGRGLLCGECANCCEHCEVYCSGIIKECAKDLLDVTLPLFVEMLACIGCFGVLDFCAVLWGSPAVRRVLFPAWLGMVEAL